MKKNDQMEVIGITLILRVVVMPYSEIMNFMI